MDENDIKLSFFHRRY